MARQRFGATMADWTFAVSGASVLVAGGVVIKFYSAEIGGVQYTDLQTSAGTATTTITSSTGSDGRSIGTIPPFYGPDGIVEMWASAADGPRIRIVAGVLVPAASTTGAAALVVNVKDFGALGNGVADDTQKINDALAAVAALGTTVVDGSGAVLFFPPGIYMTDGGHNIPSYCHIVGSEMAGRYWVYNATTMPPSACALRLRAGTVMQAMFSVDPGSTAFSISNITLLGGQVGAGIDGIAFATPTQEHNLTSNNVNIIGFSGDGIRGRLFATRWSNLFIGSCKGWGLNCDGVNQWTDSFFSDCIITGNVLGGVNFDSTAHCGEIVFSACRFERSGWDPANPGTPTAVGSPGIRIHGNLLGTAFIGCSTDANSGNGVEITRAGASPTMHHITFTACRFNRDGFGNMAGVTAPNYAAVKVVGTDPLGRIGFISFTNCTTSEGTAGDGGGVPSYLHPKFGVWLGATDYFTWHGGHISDQHPGGQWTASDTWRPSIHMASAAGVATLPAWTTATRPTFAPNGIGYNEQTGKVEFFNGSVWAPISP